MRRFKGHMKARKIRFILSPPSWKIKRRLVHFYEKKIIFLSSLPGWRFLSALVRFFEKKFINLFASHRQATGNGKCSKKLEKFISLYW